MNIQSNSNVIEIERAQVAVNVRRGQHSSRVSSEWFSRPDDQRFLNLQDLRDFTYRSAMQSQARIVDVRNIEVIASADDANALQFGLPDYATPVSPSHWSFGQMCRLLSVPAGYMRQLPAAISGINVQYAMNNFRSEFVKAYVNEGAPGDEVQLRAATGPDYGRIFDYEIADAVMRIAGTGTGEMPWKIPGCIDWATGTYNPNVDITKQSTTLFASDRDMFLFLIDDAHPIEIGKLANGEPDYVFRGFYVWNSEVGSKSFGLAAFYLRGVCQNRCLWGVEGFKEVTFRHSKGAPSRFIEEIRPALASFANHSTSTFIEGVDAARKAIVAKTDDEALAFLQKRKFSKHAARSVIDTVLKEEGKPARSIWDMVQGITACARTVAHTDERIEMERVAGKLLDKVA